jgi:hypothetical protein
MNPEFEKEIKRALGSIIGRLVELGYAERTIYNSSNKFADILWTKEGTAISREVQRFYDKIMKERGATGQAEALMIFYLMVDGGKPVPPHNP